MKPVLYAEDDANDVFFMRHVWKQAGVPNPLIHVKDGRQAIDYFAGHGHYADRKKHPLPCLLLLDLNLPGKDGFEVLRWLRQTPGFETFKVVVVSGSNQTADIAAAQKLGVTDYIIKTPIPKKLLETILEKKDLWLSGPV
jgi:CheY-like chemotaxis protein